MLTPAPQEPQDSPDAGGSDGNCLLVLDDDEQIIAMIRRIAARAGCNVIATTSKVKFLQYLAEFSPNMVLIDVFLGDGDCTALLDELAIRQGIKPFRLYFMSGMGSSALMLIERIAREKGVKVHQVIFRKRDLYRLEEMLGQKSSAPS